MRIVENGVVPLKGFAGINLFGVLFVRKGTMVSARMVRHETIHTRQMRELWYVPFYVFYFAEWLVKLCIYGKRAYHEISFEREAYENENDECYSGARRRFAFLKYIFR